MHIVPELEEVKTLAAGGEYTIVPISCELLSDFTTPIETMKILRQQSQRCMMLESATGCGRDGQYSFLGFAPKLSIDCRNGQMRIGEKTIETKDPSEQLRRLLAEYKSPVFDHLPPFTGGLAGYFSYDYFTYPEPTAACPMEDPDELKDMELMLFDKIIAFDHYHQKIILMVNMKLDDVEKNYQEAVDTLKQLARLLREGKKKEEPAGQLTGEITPLFEKEAYCEIVDKAKHYIREGDIFQVVLSNELSAPFQGSLFQTYRILRTLNPSPYMFYLTGTDVEVAGASPEALTRLTNGTLYTCPLAGTRPRGRSIAEDKQLEEELLSDEKELSEHNMLIDLGRNDLGKVCEFGSVQIEKLRGIERFSHVMHIGTTISGKLRQDKDALHALEAVLPAGTLSGAPKIRACQIIGELEKKKRGIYGGAVGYLSFTGTMDACIAIRLAYKKNDRVFVRSGAGIVIDSVPEKEYEECRRKAEAVVESIRLAKEEVQ